ncbi:hypothetical protein GCM10027169_22980 [Gordonia jinhuaensis]|uniref:Uncharacterized protein n=2 Tax=Gordonia jinhuaensis TaxID=1517702 RepID=A0A916WZG6_9ACTN|nr:hypothetical protein GCM10011489_31430 [Gordonia jinhuaensis]
MRTAEEMDWSLTAREKTLIEATMGRLIRYHGWPISDEWGYWWVRDIDDVTIPELDYSPEEIARWWADFAVQDGSVAGYEADHRRVYVAVDLNPQQLREAR